jgi:arabinofuranan 3-O-arabinosyltransferase
VAYVPLLLTKRGWLADDTKIYLYLDPGHLVSNAISLWSHDVAFGTVTHQNIGYLFPMGPYFWLVNLLHVPMWVGQRIWMGSLLFVAALGIMRFAQEIGLSRRAGWIAAWPYMLTPYILVNLDRTSALLMPWAGLGWMMLFTVRAARRGDWRNPALFAIAVALVGGINATSIVMIAAAPLMYLVYAAYSKEVTWPRMWSTTAKIGGLSLVVSLWWLAGLFLEGRYGIDVLKYTESFSTVSLTSTSSEVLRGLGYWYFYGWDSLQPWTLMALTYTSGKFVPLASFVAPVAGVLAALVVRWRYRTLAVISAFLGVVIAVGSYPLLTPTPFGWLLKWFANHSTLALAMRSSNRVLPVMIIWLCLLIGAGFEASRHRLPRLAQIGAVVVILAALAAMLPLFEGKVVASNLTFPSTLPPYVHQAAHVLNQGPPNSTVLGLPGQDFAYLRYGTANDAIWPAIVQRPWVSSQVAPEGEPASSNLIRALDSTLQNNVADPQSIAPIGRLFSAGDLLLQMDQEYERFNTPIPAYMWQLLNPTPRGLSLIGTYGPPSGFHAINGPFIDEQLLGLPLNFELPKSLAIYAIKDPRTLVRTQSLASPQLVAGDGEGLVTMGATGLLDNDRTIYYDASLARGAVNRLASEPGAWLVLTDSNQKRTDQYGTLSATQGYVETAHEHPLAHQANQELSGLFPNQSINQQTVAVMTGLASVGASGYGNIITNNPEVQPYKAVDGLVNTAWEVAAFGPAVGQYWQMTALKREPISTIHLTQVQSITQNRWITKVGISIDGGRQIVRALGAASRGPGGQTVTVPERTGRTIRLTILGDTDDDHNLPQASGVGFAEVGVKGFGPVTRGLLAPTSLLNAAGPGAATDRLSLVFNRLRVATHPERIDPELYLLRYFLLPFARSFSFAGYANVNPAIGDDQLNSLLGRHPGPGLSIAGAESSSRLTGSLYTYAWSAFDNDASTGWAPLFKRGVGEWVRADLTGATTLSNFTMTIVNDGYHMIPTSMRVSNGSTSELVTIPVTMAPQRGHLNATETVHLHIAPLRGSRFTFTIASVKAVPVYDRISGGVNFPSLNIVEIAMPGVSAGVTPSTFPSQCRSNIVAIDGHAIPVAVTGTMADALAQKRLRVLPCQAAPFVLPAGTAQSVSSTAGYLTGINVNNVMLDSTGTNPAGPASVDPVPASWHGQTVVHAVLAPSMAGRLVVLGQSYNIGWHAILAGHDLGAPTLVDGASMAWQLPASLSGPTEITFAWQPQKVVNIAVALSSVALLSCLAIAVTGRPRRRRGSLEFAVADDVPLWGGFDATLHERPFALYLTAAAVGLAVSPVALLALLVLSWLWVRRRSLGRWIAIASAIGVVAAAAITVTATQLKFVHDISWPEHVHWANTAAWIGLALWVLVVVGTGTLGDGAAPARSVARVEDPEAAPTAVVASSFAPPAGAAPQESEPETSPTPASAAPPPTVAPPTEPPPVAPVTPPPPDAPAPPTVPTPAPAEPPPAPSSSAAAGAGVLGAELARQASRRERSPDRPLAPGERRRGLNLAPGPGTEPVPDDAALSPTMVAPVGLRRTAYLLRNGWRMRRDPEQWQALLAQDVMSQMVGRTPIFNRRVLEVTDSNIFYGADLVERGAHVVSLRREATDMEPLAGVGSFTESGMPGADGQFDVVLATNVLSSVSDAGALLDELIRVTRHGGTLYIQNRLWGSPWGGYETSPWHMVVGGARARRRYVRKHGAEPYHRYGENLFALRPRHVVKMMRRRPELIVFVEGPRILPSSWGWTLRVPLLRGLLVHDVVIAAERR